MKMTVPLFVILMQFIVACDKEEEPNSPPNWVADVQSNTSWSGYFGNRTVDGSGNEVVDLPDDEIVCCSVQKQTEAGTLTVTVKDQHNGTTKESATTNAEYGVVSVCNQ
ncbi:MAG: hypothetical protein PHI18_08245 [bacterium]|nr:hypothetical protein [bacterium]